MTNAEPMKLKEGLQETFNILAGIMLPALPAAKQAEMTQMVALPIMQAMGNMQSMIEAIDYATGAEEQTQPDPDEEKAIREEDL